MAIVRVQTGTAATTTGTGTITPTLPGGATAGNIIVALIAVNTPTTAPTVNSGGGATKQVENATGSAAGTAIFTKVAAGGETNIGAFTLSTGTRDMYGVLLEYSGMSSITAERTQSGGSGTAATVLPTGVTASGASANDLVLGIEAHANATQTATVARAAGDASTGGTVAKLAEAASANATNAQKITARVSEVIITGAGVVGHQATIGTARFYSAAIAAFTESAGGPVSKSASDSATASDTAGVISPTPFVNDSATATDTAVLTGAPALGSQVPGTDTAALTNDGTANWGNSPDRVIWWNGYKSRWDAVLPLTAPPAAGQSDWWIVKDVAGSATNMVLVDARSGSRPTTVWDEPNKRLYALMEAVGGQGGSLIWAFDYNDTADTYTVVSTINGVNCGVLGMGGDSNTALARTPNGYLWVGSSRGGAGIVVNRSTDNGATWGTPLSLKATQADGKLAMSYFINAGTTYVCVANGENGIAAVPGPAKYHFLYLDQASSGWGTAGNWTDNSANIPAFSSANIEADDETCLARDANENIYWITETENIGGAGSSDEQWLLYKRTPSGTWSKTAIHSYDGQPSRKRPTISIDDTNSAIYVFANTDNDTNIVYRTAPLSNLSALTSASDIQLFSQAGKGHRNTHPPANVTGASDLPVLCDQQTDDYVVRNVLPIASGATSVNASDSATATDVVSAYARTVADAATAADGFETGLLYGTPYNTDGASNNYIKGNPSESAAIRFRAQHTGTFVGIKNWWVFPTTADGSGPYGGGTGGHVVVELRTDDGTGNHFPSSTVLSSFDIPDPMERDGNVELRHPIYATGYYAPLNRLCWNFREITMPPVAITAGTLYHLVYRNIDADPTTNFVSLDFLYNAANVPNMQPGISDLDMASLWYSGGWVVRNWETPIYEAHYADGFKQGFGYSNATIGGPHPIYGTNKVRTLFTPPRTFETRTVTIRLKSVGTPGPLQVSLIDAVATVLDSGSIASVPTTDTWVSYTFTTPQRLIGGQQYRLELSATGDASNRYSIYGFYDGRWGHFSTSPFPEGRAQIDTGSGWTDTFSDSGFTGGDLQLYFPVAASVTLTAAIPATDTAVGVDTATTLAKAVTDTAVGTDTAPTLAKPGTDSAVGSDTSALTVPYAVTDTATGADTSSLQAGNVLTAVDAAVGVDTVATLARPVADTGLAVDASSVQAGNNLSVSDSAVGSDNSFLTTDLLPAFESGSFQDVALAFQMAPSLPQDISIAITLPTLTQAAIAATNTGVFASDSVSSSDLVTAAARPVADTVTSTDAAPTLGKAVTDSATAAEAVVNLDRVASDAATGADAAVLTAALPVTDSATGVESIPTLAKATTDAASGADAASALTTTLAAFDSGVAVDTSLVPDAALPRFDSAVGADTALVTNVPQNLIAVAVSTNEIDLTWDVFSGAVAYDIERDGAIIAFDVPTNAYDDLGLSPATLYTYRVRAVL